MTKLILVRHGQSLANAQDLFAGHSDFDLSEIGFRQARRAADWIAAHEQVDVIYSSDLLRAYHTATTIGKHLGLPIISDEGLREIFAGEWEGLSFPFIAEHYADAFDVWRNNYSAARPVGGESTAEVYRRIVPHVLALAERHEGKTLLLATHATVIRAFDAYAAGLSAEQTGRVPFCYNAAINLYSCERGFVAPIRSNITEHLGDLATALPPIINA